MRSTVLALCLGATLGAALPAGAALPPGVDDASIAAAAVASFPEFLELLALPNDSAKPADIQRNAAWLEAAFRRRGFTTRLLENKGRPLVFAEYGTARPGQKTVLYYIHFDAQPVVPSQWAQKDAVAARREEARRGRDVGRGRPRRAPEARLRPRAARLRALVLRRQGPDRDVPRGLRPPAREEDRPGVPRQGPPRQRGGGRFARHRRGRRRRTPRSFRPTPSCSSTGPCTRPPARRSRSGTAGSSP